MKHRLFSALAVALALLLGVTGLSEELGEVDLYAPEICGGYEIEAPAAEPPAADEPVAAEPVPDQPAEAEPVPDQPVDAVQTVALTGKKAKAQMNVYDTLQIVVNEGETGKFTSKTKKLAKVDANGVVTAIKKGKAKIVFKPAGGKKRTLTIRIADPYAPTGVSIAEGRSVTVNLGDTLQLNAALAPETARSDLTWKSSKAKVASVDGGVVSALKEGKAKITVTTRNKKKATITVKVVNPYKPAGVSITLGDALSLDVGQSVQLEAALQPEGSRAALKWSSSKKKVATVDENGLVTAVGGGKAKITVKAGKGVTDVLTLQVIDPSDMPRSPAMNTAMYNGVEYKVVNTIVDPFAYANLVYDRVCTHPAGTKKYSGTCLSIAFYYVHCLMDNVTNVNPSTAAHKWVMSRKLKYSTEKYSSSGSMMARLYDLLSAGVPQVLMVEAITHPGSRHFVTVVGYKSSVTQRRELGVKDLLIIDSFDGKLESMDPAIEKVDTRVLFKQQGKYRIEAAWRR